MICRFVLLNLFSLNNFRLYGYIGRTRILFVETYILQQIGFCASILSGLCWTVLDTLHRKFRCTPEKMACYTGNITQNLQGSRALNARSFRVQSFLYRP